MDVLEETGNQGYVLSVYVNIHVNMKYKRTPMKFGTVFIGVISMVHFIESVSNLML